MRNIDIKNIIESYKNISGDIKLPISVAWKRRLNIHKLNEAYNLIIESIAEIEKEYIDDEHSIELENGNRNVLPKYLEEYNHKIIEVLMQDTPIEIEYVSIDELGDVNISDKELDTLEFMISK